jgi:hypothetical protein
MTVPTFTAARTMRARLTSRCALDCCLITVGQSIGYVPGIGWAAVTCIIRKQTKGTTV